MRISLLDHSGLGLGLAAGLVQLGHSVRYVGPQQWPDEPVRDVVRQQREIEDRFFGGGADTIDPADDLVIVQSSFADQLESLHEGLFHDQRVDVDSPMRETMNPVVYPTRLKLWTEIAAGARRFVAIDCSDSHGEREIAFEHLPTATLLAREVPLGAPTPWRPFPFLYNPVLLWLELMRPSSEWLVPAARRPKKWDWAFCGTIDHARYRGLRRKLLTDVKLRWPQLDGVVSTTASFVDVLKVLQSVRCGVDLPGAGELCFRLHELLALGVPVLRPWPFGIHLPAGIERAMVVDPRDLDGLDFAAVTAIYRECYSPRAAAESLLAAVADQKRREVTLVGV